MNRKKKILHYISSYIQVIQCKWSECDEQVGVMA